VGRSGRYNYLEGGFQIKTITFTNIKLRRFFLLSIVFHPLFIRICCALKWWLGAESNRRHKDFQSSALPTELPSPGMLQKATIGKFIVAKKFRGARTDSGERKRTAHLNFCEAADDVTHTGFAPLFVRFLQICHPYGVQLPACQKITSQHSIPGPFSPNGPAPVEGCHHSIADRNPPPCAIDIACPGSDT
jgi:hypothetical protein